MLIWLCRFRFIRPDVANADSIRLKIWRAMWACRSSSPCDAFGEHHRQADLPAGKRHGNVKGAFARWKRLPVGLADESSS